MQKRQITQGTLRDVLGSGIESHPGRGCGKGGWLSSVREDIREVFEDDG